MKLLLHNGLPRSYGRLVDDGGGRRGHVGDAGLAGAEDLHILSVVTSEDHVVITLDADFHTLIATRALTRPSVIRIRIEGLKAPPLGAILLKVVDQFRDDLNAGAVASVGSNRARCHRLPLHAF